MLDEIIGFQKPLKDKGGLDFEKGESSKINMVEGKSEKEK